MLIKQKNRLILWGSAWLAILALLAAACVATENAQSPAPADSAPFSNTAESAFPAETVKPTITVVQPTIHPSSTPEPTVPPEPEVIAGLTYAENVNPLTGLEVSDPSLLERRPVMVKVSNYPPTGRPHAGLSAADQVYEYYIGFGANRFLAIYLGQDSTQVGPIRSGRLVDAQLGEMYQGLLVYGNADSQVDDDLLQELGPRALASKNMPCPPVCYQNGVMDVTTLFADTEGVSQYVTQLGEISNGRRDLRAWVFGDAIPEQNEIGFNLGVHFGIQNRGEWHYDPDSGKYLRWIEELGPNDELNMIPLIDRNTGQQLAFSNVVILYATYEVFAPTLHDIKLFDNTTGKRAIFFRDGAKIEGTWRTINAGRPPVFFTSVGLPMELKPGNTWVMLVDDASRFTEKDAGSWELVFDLP